MPSKDLLEDLEKKKTLLQLCSIVFVLALIFALLNFNRQQYAVSVVEFAGAVVSGAFYFFIQQAKSRKLIACMSLAYISMFLGVVLFVVYQTSGQKSSIAWLFVAPIIAYLALGRASAIKVTGLFLLLYLLMFAHQARAEALAESIVNISNIVFSFLFVWALSDIYESANEKSKNTLAKLASTDQLTGLLNRTTLPQVFNRHIKRGAVSLVVLDIDWFKSFNDRFGHDTGDEVLKHISQTFLNQVRNNDFVFRLGGEEFCIIMPKCEHDDAFQLTKKLRTTLNQAPYMVGDTPLTISFSAGVASCSELAANRHDCKLSNLLKLADTRMYQAKSLGRNIVVAYDAPNP